MNRPMNKVIVGAAMVGIAVMGSVMNSHRAAAQGPPNGLAVRIASPLPVPVSGTTTISGSVAASQFGAWSVGISGTPNVHPTTTADRPLITQEVSRLASNLVRLDSDILSPGDTKTAFRASVDGVFTPFVVPSNRSFVLTSVDIDPIFPGPGVNGVYVTSGPAVAAVAHWEVPNGSVSQFTYPAGIVFPSGSSVDVVSIPASTDQVIVYLGGYLTSN